MKFTEQLDGERRENYDGKLFEVPYLMDAISEMCVKVKKIEVPGDIFEEVNGKKEFQPWAESLLRWMMVLFSFEFAVQMVVTLANDKEKRSKMFSEEFKNYLGTVHKMGDRDKVEDALYKHLELEKNYFPKEIDYSSFEYSEDNK